ncbi:unnamed protein product [Bursaphelenchus okinawaensis]|uniref:SCP domain-containing protein n=1 Tax=Bursaphelenchus okinawaensis TaxID=465554 RepID=A0A811L4R6_9BILA|nr:unnamed protein product [Bursaphelenchus okinawaensis]CAG9116695.1 unnamed protein product [Bursaphelenchus okinawaensis]
MKTLLFFLCLATVTGTATADGLSDDDRTFVLDYHNNYRRTVALGQQAGANGNLPTAANMLEFEYDTAIEADAQAWANNCSFGYTTYSGGQNLILYETSSSGTQNYSALLKAAVDEFFGQVTSFNISYVDDYSSSAGSMFSQVIWANTSSIGCGVQSCPNLDSSSSFYAYIVVCFYQSAGDTTGQPIYAQGESCSQCPSGRVCDNGLCALSSETTISTTTPTTTITTTVPAIPTTNSAAGSGNGLSDDDRTFVLNYHNNYRRTVALGQQAGANGNLPTAANMLEFEYDTVIEADAQAWANNCSFGYTTYSGGQNMILYETSSSGTQNYSALLKAAVDEFFGQVTSFNISYVDDYSSTAGSMFSQVIWAETSSIGCGIQSCPNLDSSSSFYAYIVVCFYQTAGDTTGQPIYIQGDTCSQCPNGRVCDNGLCAASNTTAATTTGTTAASTAPTTTSAPGSGAGLSADERTFVVNYHNNYRRTVALGQQAGENGNLPQAANMYEFTYDTSLENLAQAWANNCTLGGGGYGAVGQNSVVYGFGGEPGINNTYVLQLSIDGWFSEVDSFNVSTVGNYQGQSSTFTQMIWATTYSVGCGVKQCATFTNLDSGWDNGFIIVCDYELVGNNQGMPIYIEGDACSQCPDDRICDNGLCAMDPNSTAQPGDDECEV